MVAIHDVQGNGNSSPFVAQSVTAGGIVTAVKSNGFFFQVPEAQYDADPNTSEGVFVFTSGAPPAAAAIGNSVNVTGTVTEFIPSSDPASQSFTELTSPTVALNSTGNPLPAPVTITATDTAVNTLNNLERYEGMRVTVPSLTVVSPTGGSINEAAATVTSNGLFYAVVTGVARPLREAGVNVSDTLPGGSPCCVPRFDENPERIGVDSDAQVGATALDVGAGATVTGVVGPLDYGFRTYTIDPDPSAVPGVSGQPSATPVPVPTTAEFTVASLELLRFFDTVDDPSTSDPVLTAAAFNKRLGKASLVIVNDLRLPDVIGVQEAENLTTLQSIAAKVNGDVVAGGGANPNYQAYLVEGNDVSGIDVGFLVKASRVTVVDVTQFGKTTTYINPNNGQPELLNDRPPLVLRATVAPGGGTPIPFTVIVNHLRSLTSIDDPTNGNQVRTKRRAQAEYLAGLIQGRQMSDPAETIVTLGNFNAYQVNDGYVDSIGTVRGLPPPANQVVLASSDLVNPDLTDLAGGLPAVQRYSFASAGNASELDHVLATSNATALVSRFAFARIGADFPLADYGDGARAERLSDHDAPVAYLRRAPTAVGLESLRAVRVRAGVHLSWRTGSDVRTLGFEIDRRAGDRWRRLSSTLVRGHAWLDRQAPEGPATYRLSAVGLDGSATLLGQVSLRR